MGYMTISKDLVIKNNIPEDFPYVYADENRLLQIMFNILHNAIKFTEKGEIVVTGKLSTIKMVSIEIIDSGKGMSLKESEDIFKPYVKGTDSESIGLGLKVTKELVQLHDGRITVLSNQGEGTTVTFSLPVANKKEEVEVVKPIALETSATNYSLD